MMLFLAKKKPSVAMAAIVEMAMVRGFDHLVLFTSSSESKNTGMNQISWL